MLETISPPTPCPPRSLPSPALCNRPWQPWSSCDHPSSASQGRSRRRSARYCRWPCPCGPSWPFRHQRRPPCASVKCVSIVQHEIFNPGHTFGDESTASASSPAASRAFLIFCFSLSSMTWQALTVRPSGSVRSGHGTGPALAMI